MQRFNQKNRKCVVFSPRLTRPILVSGGDVFTVVTNDFGQIKQCIECFLSNETHNSKLQITDRSGAGIPGFYLLSVRVSEGLPPGLYDLRLMCSDGQFDLEPHCVWLQEQGKSGFVCAHISDLHLGGTGGSGPRDRSSLISALLRHIAEDIRPDFIINTGDLITRYDKDKAPLPADAIFEQIRRVREIILVHRIPHFMSLGNHDIAWPPLRREWLRLMGGPWSTEHDDYSFSYGEVRFIAMDRSLTYDENHEVIEDAICAPQHERLKKELETLLPGQKAVIFCHYDYRGELAPYLERYPIFKVLYGHSGKPCIEPGLSDFDGGLRSPYDYQLLVSKPGKKLCLSGRKLE